MKRTLAIISLAALAACETPQPAQQMASLPTIATTEVTQGDITIAAAAQILAYEIDRMPDTGRNSRIALVGARANGNRLTVDVSHPFTALPPGFDTARLGALHGQLMCDAEIMRSFVQLGGEVRMNLQFSNGRTFYSQTVTRC